MFPYPVKIPGIVKKIYSQYIWDIPTEENALYLTFDDGPHPEVTAFVLDELSKYNALATFFCIGKNVEQYPEMYKRILMEGHRVGNHTHHHLNGWETPDQEYMDDIVKANKFIDSDLFRPPYGKITSFQARALMGKEKKLPRDFRIIMWDVLSGDFDLKKSGVQCASDVIKKAVRGSIITFHDSEKAFLRLKVALPLVLEAFAARKFHFRTIN